MSRLTAMAVCQRNTTNNFTDFQQNTITVDNPPAGEPNEFGETAADMFLNWVYRQNLLLTPVVYGDEGFENAAWDDGIFQRRCGDPCLSDITSGQYSASNGPGDDRYLWMQTTLISLANYYGW
jgi:hypothetical protein